MEQRIKDNKGFRSHSAGFFDLSFFFTIAIQTHNSWIYSNLLSQSFPMIEGDFSSFPFDDKMGSIYFNK